MSDTPSTAEIPGFAEAWSTFNRQLSAKGGRMDAYEHSSYECKLAEAFFAMGKTHALQEMLTREIAHNESPT